jgi:hypothetical protein
MILAIDCQTSDRADGPVLGQRLRKRGVVLEDRNLYFLRLTNEVMLPGPDRHEREAQRGFGDSRQMHASVPIAVFVNLVIFVVKGPAVECDTSADSVYQQID